MKVLALCGYPRAGKDAIAEHLCGKYCFQRVSFADPIREALLALDPIVSLDSSPLLQATQRLSVVVSQLGWTKAKEHSEVRQLLQRMGTEAGRDVHGTNCWVNIARKKIENSQQPVVITDLRFDNELAMVRKLDSSFVMHVTRPEAKQLNNHLSERMDYGKVSDGTIHNNGSLQDLYKTIDEFLAIWTN